MIRVDGVYEWIFFPFIGDNYCNIRAFECCSNNNSDARAVIAPNIDKCIVVERLLSFYCIFIINGHHDEIVKANIRMVL